MTPHPMPLLSKACLGVAISLSVFVLTACSAEADSPQPGAPIEVKEGTGILETSAGSYVFTPSTCAIYRGDGVDDIEIQGPGMAPDGEKFFFELSSIANAMTIDIGVDSPFASPDRQLMAGRVASQEFTIVVSDRKISVSGMVLVDENGGPIDGDATIKIDCGA